MSKRRFIEVRNVTKRFGRVRALHAVDIEVEEGEFFALLGPSGCGKTTLLRILAGFESPTEGEVFIDAQAMSAVPANRRPVNMVFQNYAIFPHLNVRQNLAYGLRRQKLPRAELDAVIERALALIKLEGFGERRSDQLSGGQRQRVALARALVKQPKVLLLDEPLGALDKRLREQMQVELRALQQEVGVTFVFVTHDQEEALSMSDRIAVMSEGEVLQVDTPERLYERPVSREVADFIGTMNFVDGKVEEVDGGTISVDAGPLGRVSAASGEPPRPVRGARVLIAIRPEKIAVSREKPERPFNVVRGRVSAASYLGDRSHLRVDVPGLAAPISVASQNVLPLLHSAHAAESDAMWLSWPAAAVVVLPAE
jgi:spermidine/putrescine ABC transporter ATP-binding subunit